MSTTSDSIADPGEPQTESDTDPVDFDYEVIIRARTGWQLIDWRELVEYRDLFRFLVWRSIKVQYAQSMLGIGWAVIQPVFSMIIFTIVFGYLAGIESDGAPYAVFAFAALVPWTYFSNALTDGTNSLLINTNMHSKVYFPRMMLPLSAVFAKLIDFCVAMLILCGLIVYYGIPPNAGVLALPWLIGLMMLTAAGLVMWLSALAVQYRDIKYAMNFIVQALMYCTPVVYPASLIPWTYKWGDYLIYPRLVYSINPMVGVIEGFRSALLGSADMPWALLAVGSVSAAIIAASGSHFFRKKERLFADVA